MKQALLSVLVLFQLLSCGRARDVEPGDGAGAGGADRSEQTGGTSASGGNSGNASGGSGSGGDVAWGGMGGEGELPLCEALGYPVPTVTQEINLSHALEEDSFDGFVQVSFSTPQSVNLLVDGEPLVSLDGLFGQPDDVLETLFTEGEQVHLSLKLSEDGSSVCVLSRESGEFIAFIHEGIFHPELVASMGLPITWSFESTCRLEEPGYDVFERLNLYADVGAIQVELAAYDEQQVEIEGKPFVLTVHYMMNVGHCSGEACGTHPQPEGLNLDAQLTALE